MDKLSVAEMDFMKGIGIGMVAGAAIGMIVAPKKKSKSNSIGKAVKAAGELINNVTNFFS